jgi:hypothetical protein
MVHALEEIRRTLVPHGLLIDLRPLADRWRVELVTGLTSREMGRLTDLPAGLADDQAANDAIQAASRRGWFVLESHQSFPFYYYWDSPEEMLEHIQEKWGDYMQLGQQVYSNIQKTWAGLGTDRRVRVKVKMHLARWQKH